MTTAYPGAVDALPRPGSTTYTDDSGYELDLVIDNISDAIEAVQSQLGATAADGSILKYIRRSDKSGNGLWVPSGARRNYLLNPRFAFTPDGTSFSSAGYTLDQWIGAIGSGGSPAATMSQQAHTLADLDHEPRYFYRHNQTAQATSTNPSLSQRLDDVRTLANQKVTLSFWAKCSSGTVVVTPRFTQNFGSGGSPSSAVNTDGSTVTVTTTWTRYARTITVPSITGKTIGSTASTSYIQAWLLFPLSSTYTVDISQIQLEAGEAAGDFEVRDQGYERWLLAEYYVALQADDAGDVFGFGQAYATSAAVVGVQLPRPMRVAPSLTISSIGDFYLSTAAFANATLSGGSATFALYKYLPVGAQAPVQITTIPASPLTQGQATFLYSVNTSAKMAYSARL